MTATHTVLIPLTMERPLSADEFEELISWAESTGAYNGGMTIVDNDYASQVLDQLGMDVKNRRLRAIPGTDSSLGKGGV